jgi:hypothetical protein
MTEVSEIGDEVVTGWQMWERSQTNLISGGDIGCLVLSVLSAKREMVNRRR